MGDATGSAAEDVALAVGVLLLFAAAIFVTALVAGRMRATSDDAGGNAAAAVPRYPGTARVGADLDLRLPVDTPPGTYIGLAAGATLSLAAGGVVVGVAAGQ